MADSDDIRDFYRDERMRLRGQTDEQIEARKAELKAIAESRRLLKVAETPPPYGE